MADDTEVHVREERLPGVGQVFHLPLDDGATVSVVVDDRSTDREIDLLPAGADEPAARIHLTEAQAVTLATLLTGVRVVFESQPAAEPATGVHVETIVLSAASPAVGSTMHDLALPDPDAARVLAVIRDDTPELLEEDRDRPCQPGDRLVLAGRPQAIQDLRRHLAG
jgi:TrkA domain protein